MKSFKEQADELIEEKCKSNSNWTDIGEDFFRKCMDTNKYSIEGKIIGKCKPKSCATCNFTRLPLRKEKMKILSKAGEYFLKDYFEWVSECEKGIGRASFLKNEIQESITKLKEAIK